MNDKKSAAMMLHETLEKYNSKANDISKFMFNERERKLFVDMLEEFSEQFKPKAVEVEKLKQKFYNDFSDYGDSNYFKTGKGVPEVWQWIQDNCLSQANEVGKPKEKDLDEIRELGKQDVSYDRQLAICGLKEANNVLYFWMKGYEFCLSHELGNDKQKLDLVELTNQYLEDGDDFEGKSTEGRYKRVFVERKCLPSNKNELGKKEVSNEPKCLHEWDEGNHNVYKCKKCGEYNCR